MEIQAVTQNIFQDKLLPKDTTLVGYSAIIQALGIKAPVRRPSCVSKHHIMGSIKEEVLWRIYDKRYLPKNTFAAHITFALKHEDIDLLVLKRIFQNVPKKELEKFILETPMGNHTRRVWFLYEFLTGEALDIPDSPNIGVVNLLDPEKYFTINRQISKRHRVHNNLLGINDFCPVIRKTEKLQSFISMNLPAKVRETIDRVSNQLIARAASFMLLADSRASFEIEGERPPRNRLERWAKVITQAGKYPLSLDEIIRLHNILITDTRFIQPGLRKDGVFLGERDHNNEPLPEFIGAKPEDLDLLVKGLIESDNQMLKSDLDPVLQAAATAFGFVYIHPLQDGNGRLHRYLIHHVLAEKKFAPQGLIFPVSSIMLNHIDDYRKTLQEHSAPLMDYIEWRPTPNGNVEVLNDTADLYRYYDCTEEAEFLYNCVQHTVEDDLPREIDYLKRHDEAMRHIMDMIEMPDRLAQDFILFTRQNNGTLPKSRRKKMFEALTDEEVASLEAIVKEAFEGFQDKS